MEVTPSGDGPALTASFRQTLPSGRVEGRGAVLLGERTLTMMLAEIDAETPPPLLQLVRPAVPGSLLAGHMLGGAMLSPDGQPTYVTRIAMVRVPTTMQALSD